MRRSPPNLPPHKHDDELAREVLDCIGSAITDHQCDRRPDHLYIPEHELFVRARAGLENEQILSYIWAEHERWEKPAVVFMLGWGQDMDQAAAQHIGREWAAGVQPGLCALFHDPRRPPLRLVSYAQDRPEEKLPWRGACGPTHGWGAQVSNTAPVSESHFLHAIMNDVCGQLHRREILSVLSVLTVVEGKPDATVYLDGHVWPQASASLRAAPLPEDRSAERILCQKLYMILEPCRWEDVEKEDFLAEPAPQSNPPAQTKWWKRLLGR